MSLALEGGFVTHEINKVSWFVKFPSHWNLLPAKRLFPESKERAQESDEQLSATQEYGVIPQSEFMRLAGRRVVQLLSNIELRKRVEVDDFVISMRSFQGGLERAWACGGIRSSYVVLRPVESVYIGYYQFLFKSDVYIQALQSTANFIRDGQDMNYQNFVLIDLPYPPHEEQRQIAAFLQHEITKIDSLIAEQEKLIALLKEKRQAVISHAVTKGLNPNAPMKDSGVEWLGQVPEHWDVSKVKYIKSTSPNSFVDGPFGSNLKTEHFTEDGEVFVIESNFATQGILNIEELKKITSDHFESISRSEVRPTDIVIAKIGAQFGKSSILPDLPGRAVVSGNSMKLTVNESLCTNVWAMYQLYLLKVSGEVELLVNGSAQPALSLGGMNTLFFLLPPLSEQQLILNHLNEQLYSFDELNAQALAAVGLLKERRSALISAAVTGKIDVRGWQPPAAQ